MGTIAARGGSGAGKAPAGRQETRRIGAFTLEPPDPLNCLFSRPRRSRFGAPSVRIRTKRARLALGRGGGPLGPGLKNDPDSLQPPDSAQ